MIDLTCDLGFLKLRNPVIAASGTFGYGLEMEPFLDLETIGAYVLKGLYLKPKPGNPPPRLVETFGGLINSIGLQGIGTEAFVETILPHLRKYNTPLIINVCGESDEEYAAVIERLEKEEGIAAYELNISCPNVKQEGLCPALSAEATYTIVKLARKESHRPLITKLSPNVTDIVSIALAAQEAGSNAISLINTILAMAVNADTRKPLLANIFGGLSGPAIKPIALRMVFQVAQNVKIPVIGGGGIMTGRDAIEFLLVGARAVQIGTANLIDPQASCRITHEIEEYCLSHGVKKISELVGGLILDKD
ncbi:MAG: dihydroorotate dehydrogenase [Candidatus Aminicenantes bacterium]|nr:dihydroorotate dehydrogenase [Candidatus Aminicenantes bacterium]